MINQRRIIYFLIAVIAALLLLNVILSHTQTKPEQILLKRLNIIEIEERFNLVLKSYGISDDWINKKKLRNMDYDSVKYSHQIKFPPDVPIPQFIKDLNQEFSDFHVTISSKEKKNYITELNIIYDNQYKLHSLIRYGDKLVRSSNEIGFLLSNIESASESDLEFLFKQGIPFGVILPLDEESQILAERIKQNKIDYFIVLKEDSDKIDFELDQEFSLEKLSQNVKNIISSFNSPRTFFFDQRDDFNLQIENFLVEQFSERERDLVPIDNYVNIHGENSEDLISLFQFHIRQINKGERKLFRMNYKDWFQIHESLQSYLKQGNKIISTSNYL